ncbi:hypothetical protein OO013_07945 [Mangrovivirga sp. M17]|uniref:Addiction module component n=1 Tax=Mangrovivirga halotolerans TaxID=2993936 RepID=A0ABT3RPS8_9BACT|nr:hypothetical protein [Mangrovivirga halotolerans]MCX2743792.1 hypothetical protein [Mangrovivirga halotolerans]
MNTREKLLERIQNIKDEKILEEMLEMIELEMNLSTEIIELNTEQKSAIDQGLKDIDEGKSMNQKDVDNFFKEWLNTK